MYLNIELMVWEQRLKRVHGSVIDMKSVKPRNTDERSFRDHILNALMLGFGFISF